MKRATNLQLSPNLYCKERLHCVNGLVGRSPYAPNLDTDSRYEGAQASRSTRGDSSTGKTIWACFRNSLLILLVGHVLLLGTPTRFALAAQPDKRVIASKSKPTPQPTAEKTSSSSTSIDLGSSKNRNEPVYISSDKLELDSEKRVFIYSGNVKVVQAEVTITSQEMIGTYATDNKIETITARKDVVITKGLDLRATSQAGVYNTKTGIVTLTENPHLFQGGNDLAADKITIDLNTNKSSAQGQVRMKVIKAPATEALTK